MRLCQGWGVHAVEHTHISTFGPENWACCRKSSSFRHRKGLLSGRERLGAARKHELHSKCPLNVESPGKNFFSGLEWKDSAFVWGLGASFRGRFLSGSRKGLSFGEYPL